MVALSTGHRIVVDKNEKTVIRYSPEGRYLGPFVPAINTERLAVNALDDVAMIDKDAKGDHHRRSRRQAAVADSRQGPELSVR